MMLQKTMIAAGLAIAATCGVASAQGLTLPEGRVYTFHSGPQASCPGLDWHLVVESNGVLKGMVAWDAMKSMASAEGTVNVQARTFQMSAVKVGDPSRTAKITGTVRSDGWLIADIEGPNVHCKGIAIPFGTGGAPAGGNG